MLTELAIKDFAIIEELHLAFKEGFIAFTGETGAGKSIILDAVEALIGGRADTSVVRSGADIALIEGTFSLPTESEYAASILKREDLLDDPHTVVMSREVRSNGRSIARINGRNVPVSLLREVGGCLVDLHGQSEHLSLLHTPEHLPLLDRYANVSDLLQSHRSIYAEWKKNRDEWKALQQASQDAARRMDLLQFQLEEINKARLQTGEDDTLRAERTRLANAEGLASLVQEALQVMDEGDQPSSSVIDLMGQVVHALDRLRRLDETQNALSDQATLVLENLNDLSRNLHDYLDRIEFNPKRLDVVEERLDLINGLFRKYGATIPEVIAYGQKISHELENISNAEERQAELEKLIETQLLQVAQAGESLSNARRSAAEQLAQAIQTELDDLRMEGAKFQVNFHQIEDAEGVALKDGRRVAFDENGLEGVEFLIAPNPGEGFKPLVKIASGGETSRLMLALKNVLARADRIPTLIFDEIDQGIGGRVGGIVGQKLWQLARHHQVLCVTHLPQLAAFGDQHFQVQKSAIEGRTQTQVKEIAGEERIVELAQMLGDVSDGTLRSAFELLHAVNQTTASGDPSR